MSNTTEAPRVRLELTLEEAKALDFIVGNGWGDGDFQGYGGSHVPTQLQAMKKLSAAIAKAEGSKG